MAMLYLTHLPRSVLTCLFVLQDTLHFAVSSDMSKGVDEILARTQKKSEREKVQDARKEGLQQSLRLMIDNRLLACLLASFFPSLTSFLPSFLHFLSSFTSFLP